MVDGRGRSFGQRMRWTQGLLVAFAAVFQWGCGGGGTSAPSELVGIDAYRNESACAVGYQDGPEAIRTSGIDIVTTFFQKPFDQNSLRALLQASARSTFDFIAGRGVRVFVAGQRRAQCAIFETLPRAQGPELEEWNRVNSTVPEGQTILGLYLEKRDGPITGAGTIIMIADTSRWTLVHEYMHHLFATEFQKNMKRQDLQATKGVAMSNFYSLYDRRTTLSSVELREMGRQLQRYSNFLRMVLQQYPLEEVTIERTLVTRFLAGEFGFVPKVDAKNGIGYIHSSVRVVAAISQELEDLLLEVRSLLSSHNANDSVNDSDEELSGELRQWRALKLSLQDHNEFVRARGRELGMSVGLVAEPGRKESNSRSEESELDNGPVVKNCGHEVDLAADLAEIRAHSRHRQ